MPLRDQLLESAHVLGVLDAVHRLMRQRCTVLLYHSVAADGVSPFMNADTFRAHMSMLRDEFNVVTADAYRRSLAGQTTLPRRSVLITFDDGFENSFTVVQPIMRALGLPWVLFTTTISLRDPGAMLWMTKLRAVCLFAATEVLTILDQDWTLGETRADRLQTYKRLNRWIAGHPTAEVMPAVLALIETHWPSVPADYVRHYCRLVDSEQLCELARSGLVEIGCHTRSHPFMPRLTAESLREEVVGALEDLRAVLGRRPTMFSYPSGLYGAREIRALANAGIELGFAVAPSLGRDPAFEIPRIGIYRSSPAVLRGKALGLAQSLRRIGFPNG
jgi:peptidoglycan/xylan/chitin deacetylase (PgdA/CDA1 family)